LIHPEIKIKLFEEARRSMQRERIVLAYGGFSIRISF